MDEEKNVLILGKDIRKTKSIDVEIEVATLLFGKQNLRGFYDDLLYCEQVGILNHIGQEDLAKVMGLASQTFYTYRDELVKLELIGIDKKNKLHLIYFNDTEQLRPSDLTMPIKPELIIKHLQELKSNIKIFTSEKIKEKQNQIKIDLLVKDEIEKINKHKEEIRKKEEIKFPRENYLKVLAAYQQLKGIKLHPSEYKRWGKTIKTMFQAEYTVDQIINCMKFFAEHKNDEDFSWMRIWTLEAIRKWMPEFIAGNLKSKKLGDDLPNL